MGPMAATVQVVPFRILHMLPGHRTSSLLDMWDEEAVCWAQWPFDRDAGTVTGQVSTSMSQSHTSTHLAMALVYRSRHKQAVSSLHSVSQALGLAPERPGLIAMRLPDLVVKTLRLSLDGTSATTISAS